MSSAQPLVSLLVEQCPELDLAETEIADVQAGLSNPRTTATIAYQPNHAEFERRRSFGLSGITNLGHLDLLMELPAGLPVIPDSADRRTLCRLPKGCVDITADGFVRQLTKPLDVKLAIATRARFPQGFVHAGRFAPYSTRVLALTGKSRNLQEAAIEADFWGIGLIVNAATNPELVVPPEPFIAQRHTPAGWAFAEDIYRQVAEQARSSTADVAV